jgi:branched-chain amino acid transport system permease protein
MLGGFIAAFIISEMIAVGGYFAEIEWGYVIAFIFFIVMMFIRPQGLLGNKR